MGADGRAPPRRGHDGPARQTGVDPWFLDRLENVITMEQRLLAEELHPDILREAKRWASATRWWRSSRTAYQSRSGRRGTSGASCPCTRWWTPARPSSTPRRPTSTARTRRRTKLRRSLARRGGRGERADPHRAGDRVRLCERARRVGAPGRRSARDHGELQPGNRLHRLRHERPPLLRAA